eukprot:TRINITY_DN3299_c0_g1_i6.p1 TRINITY_DN3299_c0_g1~~TRINITY_DN3299_c0_g1_i6.p1  ORF type:complete len:282 (+),score=46.16 TRINITY_DN3299_c0_g1_i6:38-883(+)
MTERRKEEKAPSQIVAALKDVTAGTVGGILQALVGHPFDTVKVRLQTTQHYAGMVDCFKTIIKEEGFLGLYKGVQSPLAGLAGLNATLFFAYGRGKELVRRSDQKFDDRLSLTQFTMAGVFAGFFSALIEGPFDFFKCQLQVRYKEFRGFFDCANKITRNYGIRGIYQGQGATQLRNIPSNALYFGSYELMKNYLCSPGENINALPTWKLLASGGFAGLAYWGITYPFDVVKSTMQADTVIKADRKYKTVLDTFRIIYSESGFKGFYRGCLLYTSPSPRDS